MKQIFISNIFNNNRLLNVKFIVFDCYTLNHYAVTYRHVRKNIIINIKKVLLFRSKKVDCVIFTSEFFTVYACV
jgi:hypothetical protein